MAHRWRPLAILLAAYLVLATAYSVTTPLLETPDEVPHYEYVYEIATQHALPVTPASIAGNIDQESHQPPLYYVLAAAATTWIDTGDYASFVRRNPYAAFDAQTPDNRNIFLHGRAEFFPWSGVALGMHVARIVSVLLGALAVAGTYALSLGLFPERPDWAIGGAAFVAFLPQFDFISGAVSNDAAVTALCALAFAWSVRVWRDWRTKDVVLLGVWLSLAALAKPSGMLIWPLALGVLGLDALFSRSAKRWQAIALLLGLLLLMTGWWFVRNQLVYGDLLGLDTHLTAAGVREGSWGFSDFLEQWNEIEISFWGLFGSGNVPMPQTVYDGLHLLALAALPSLAVYAVWRARRSAQWRALAVLWLWVAIVLAFFYRWNMLVVAPHGRLLFPALCAVAVLFFIGLSWFVPARWRTAFAWSWAAGFALLSAFALTRSLAPAYPRPDIVSEQAVPRQALAAPVRFGDELVLGAVELPAEGLRAGEPFDVVLYWQALKSGLQTDYTVTLQLFAADGRRIAQLDTFPTRGMYPTSQWLAGQWLRDDYPLQVAPDSPAGSATLIVGLYDDKTKKALQIEQPDGRRVGRATLGQLQVRSDVSQ